MSMVNEKLTYSNARGESVVFSPRSAYHVNLKDVSGLSGTRSTVYLDASIGQDGDTLVGTRIEARDIEIVGHFNTTDKQEIMQLRRILSRVLNPHIAATLTYEFGKEKRVISCMPYNSPSILRRRGRVFDEFAINLNCLNPFWRDTNQTRTEVAVWKGLFEFPEDGLQIVDGEWQIGQRTQSIVANVINSGDVDTGLKITFRANGTVVDPELLDVNTGEYIKINTSMESGDELVVTTGYGEKDVVLIRDGQEQSVFRLLDAGSTYLQTRTGDNLYRYGAARGVDALDVTIWHSNLYLGV